MSKHHGARDSAGKQSKKKDITRAAYTVFCCQGGDCCKRGAQKNFKQMKAQIAEAGLKGDVAFIETECMDQCKHGPMLIVCSRGQDNEDGPVWYHKVRSKDAAIIVYQHLQHNEIVSEKRFRLREPTEVTKHYSELETDNEESENSIA